MRWPALDTLFPRRTARERAAEIEQIRTWMAQHRPAMEAAEAKRVDVVWLQAAAETSRLVLGALLSYRPGQNPVRAVYLVAQAVMSLQSVHDQLLILDEWERAREDLRVLLREGNESTAQDGEEADLGA